MSISERLRKAMSHAGVKTEAELSRLCGLPQPTIHRILSGQTKSPRQDSIYSIALALGVSDHWLFTGNGPMLLGLREGAGTYSLGEIQAWDSESPTDPDEVDVPLYREVELSAGSGRTQVIENHGAKLKFARSSLKRAGVLEENAGCAYVSGNSMEPLLPDGATIGVDAGARSIKDGDMYAIDHDGQLRVKFVYRVPGGGLRLVSYNKAEHPDEVYSVEESVRHIRIIGRVFWYASFI